jgi:antitoxin PrlF
MATLTVTSRGQVTFRKDLLQHLGIQPGDKIEVDMVAGRRIEVQAARRKTKTIDDLFGILKSEKVATLEEIDEAIRAGWAGKTKWDDDK